MGVSFRPLGLGCRRKRPDWLPTCKLQTLQSRKLTWKPKKGPMKTTVPLKGDYMGFHVSLGERKS